MAQQALARTYRQAGREFLNENKISPSKKP
jgi:hypothetical protein